MDFFFKILTTARIRLGGFANLVAGINSSGKPVLLKTSDDGTLAVSSTASGVQRTPSISLVTTNGTVAAGAQSVEFIFSSDFTGTVSGVAYAGSNDAVQPFTAPTGDTLAAITYTVTAGSIRIAKIV